MNTEQAIIDLHNMVQEMDASISELLLDIVNSMKSLEARIEALESAERDLAAFYQAPE